MGMTRHAALAGWLFVDLLLVLFLVQLGTAPAAPMVPSAPRTSEPPTASLPSAPLPGLDPATVLLEIDAGVDADAVLAEEPAVRNRVVELIRQNANPYAGRQAGVVLVFGTYRPCDGCATDPGRSSDYSAALIPLFHEAAPQLFPAESSFYRNYVGFASNPGAISAEIFLLQ